MPVGKLKKLLDRERIKYATIHHSPAYTAQAVAKSAHIPGDQLAKTVMLNVDGKLVMVTLPANEQLDLDLVSEALAASSVRLAEEEEFGAMFPDCEVGAMPPFGKLYDVDTYVTESLTNDERIAFSAGTHRELMEMSYDEFARLAQPRVLHFCATPA